MIFILRKVDLPSVCTAFRKGLSIIDNATSHTGKDFVFNVDIKDFFPSITIGRVTGLFKSLGYPKEVAFSLGKITTYRGRLPQGAPSSPDIANLICRKLDARLVGLCSKRDWAYSRYADDITISGKGNISKKQITRVTEIIRDEGFEINQSKVRVTHKNRRQIVTGLVVNEKVSILRHRRRIWRAIFHQASLDPQKFINRSSELSGYLGYLKMIRPDDVAVGRYQDILSMINMDI